MATRTCVVVSCMVALAVCVGASPLETPRWTAPMPDMSKPLAGFTFVADRTKTCVYRAVPSVGTYNHAAMIHYHDNKLIASWKCSPKDEDQAGQRVLYSMSTDGVSWSSTTGDNVLFPNVSTSANPAHLFAEPFLVVNGRLYAAASPTQFCLYPDQYTSVLLLRLVGPGLHNFGPVFWAADTVPPGFEAASAALNITTVQHQNATVQGDVATLKAAQSLPCESAGTLKCEACADGCQAWSSLPPSDRLSNERSHYVPTGTEADVLLYRSRVHALWASVRVNRTGAWPPPVQTDIPDDDSNINTGALPDGRNFLLSNPNAGYKYRDPLTVATTNGSYFDTVGVVLSCTELASKDQPDGCIERYDGRAKNPGPSYPQGVTVLPGATASSTSPAPGLYVVATNNKEDVWVVHLPFDKF